MTIRSLHTSPSGFTLMELIIVMVVLGVLGTMGAEFISRAFEGFHQTDRRMEIYEEGKAALVRMEREIHIALPNAIQVNGNGVELGMIDENGMAGVFGQYTELAPVGTSTITDRIAGLPNGALVSIHNTGWAEFADGSRVYRVTSAGTNPMTLDRAITMASPYQRFFVVRAEAIRFAVDNNGTLMRETAQVNVAAALGAFSAAQPLASNVIQADGRPFFTYDPGTSTRNGVVAIHFAISRGNETVTFHKEVQVRNVP
ncbi:MAG: PulJ/GspJ family protein [Thermodesulfobacteriota bacterium]